MAISTTVNRVAYQGNGSSALFNFGYQIQSPSDLAVFAYNSSATAPQIITPYVLNASGALGYVFSGTANASNIYPSGGNIVLNSSPNAQSVMVIFRSSVVTNDFFVSQDGKISSTGLNNELDKLTIIAQRAQDIGTRSLRLPDGFYGTFDPTLPANVALQPGKQIIINSTATGLALGNDIANYLPNMLLIASGTSVITSLPGATAGLVLQSNGSSAPTWGAISLGSANVNAGQIQGVLSVGNGGTGTGTGYIQYALIFASSATNFGSIDTQVTPGFILTANSSAPPTFQSFSASNINSGVITVGNGGTGTGSSFNQFGVVFGEAATKLASTGPGGNDQPFIGNTGAAPSFRPLNMASNSSVVGVLSTANGGTGASSVSTNQLIFGSGTTQLAAIPANGQNTILVSNGSSAPSFQQLNATLINSGVVSVGNGGTGSVSVSPQYGVLYASSTSQVGVVPSAAAGTVLTANGSSAPTFQSVTVTPIAPSTKTANYAATTSDFLILCGSSNYTINLYPASGNAGRVLRVRKTSSQVNSSIIISETSLVTALHTQNEELEVTSDGTSWFPRRTGNSTNWVSYPPTINGFGSPSGVFFFSRRNGQDLEIQYTFTSGSSTANSAWFTIGFAGTNANIMSANSGVIQTGGYLAGVGLFSVAIAGTIGLIPIPDDTVVPLGLQNATTGGFAGLNGNAILSAGQTISGFVRVPIRGWNA